MPCPEDKILFCSSSSQLLKLLPQRFLSLGEKGCDTDVTVRVKHPRVTGYFFIFCILTCESSPLQEMFS